MISWIGFASQLRAENLHPSFRRKIVVNNQLILTENSYCGGMAHQGRLSREAEAISGGMAMRLGFRSLSFPHPAMVLLNHEDRRSCGSPGHWRSLFPRLSFGSEEGRENSSAAIRQDAANYGTAMVEAWVHRDGKKGMTGPRLGIRATVDHQGQPGLNDGPGTHWAGLQGHVENAIFQPPRTPGPGGLGNGEHLRVGSRIEQPFALVMSPGDDALIQPNDDRTDGDLVLRSSQVCFFQGSFHVIEMKGVVWIRQ
jgi:hypothetical protein